MLWSSQSRRCANNYVDPSRREVMTEADKWTTCTVGDVSVTIKTETPFETDRATELNQERAIIEDFLAEVHPDDVVLDGGANVGLYSLVAGSCGATVVAVEPHPANLASLEANLEHNECDATVIRGALADEVGHAPLYVAAEEAGAGTHTFAPDQVSETTITVPTYVVDDLVGDGTIPAPTIVKLDVQGSEYISLAGMQNLLAEDTLRTMYVELHPEQVRRIGGSADDVEELLESAGFALTPLVDKADVTWNIKATR